MTQRRISRRIKLRGWWRSLFVVGIGPWRTIHRLRLHLAAAEQVIEANRKKYFSLRDGLENMLGDDQKTKLNLWR